MTTHGARPMSAKASASPCCDEFVRVMRLLRSQAVNAAKRNKPTMWAYYTRMEARLRAWFSASMDAAEGAKGSTGLSVLDGGIAGAALALVQKADRECPHLPNDEAADLWAMGTYANRILRAWGAGSPSRRSLAWLRARAGDQA